ncbi:MAG: type II toxin-antitoxin system PrlF family antitoxin [Spongiibacteraceae bacterium]
MTHLAKITTKGQTTIPQAIRAALNVKPGDTIAWEVGEDGHVEVRRVQPADIQYIKAVEGTLSEWHTAEDEAAYRSL